eukprot:gene7765-9109_t
MSQTADVLTDGAALKQYVALSKGNKGRACVAYIDQALANPNLFVFGELLDVPNIQALIPYSLLQSQLEIPNVRELEDLVIESIYSNIIRGKLDQKNKHLEIEFAIGRDVPKNQIDNMLATLDNWIGTSESLLNNIGQLMQHTDKVHEQNRHVREDLEKRVEAAKSQIKPENIDFGGSHQPFNYDSVEYMDEMRVRKGAKTKGKDHKRP